MINARLTTFTLFISILLCFLVLSSYASTKAIYTMKDLEILEEQQSYKEFFDHALDLRPVERNNHWRDLVYRCSENYLKELILTQRYAKHTLKYVEKISNWPTLRNNQDFQNKRSEYGLKYFEFCLENEKKANILQNSECTSQAHAFWKNTPKDYGNLRLGPKLAKLTQKYLPGENLWFYYSNIISNKHSSDICDDSSLAKAFLNRIKVDPNFSTEQNQRRKLISKYLSNSCKQYLVPHIKKILSQTQDSKDMAAYLSILTSINSLKQSESDFFLTKYVLDGPHNGPMFNMAWNTLEQLGKDYKRRESVIKKFKQMDSLPGNLFEIEDKNRLSVIMGLITKHFPEYINHYGATCIKYLKGKISSHKGSPTPGCHELFRRSSHTNWISKDLKRKYKESL